MVRFLLAAALAGMLALAGTTVTAAGPQRTDAVRVLIDVSGSMKKTDPGNLRTPALRMLVNLLPEDSEAGIWHFAQYVNRVTPVGPADEAWRSKALEAADRIHSRGLFTDIGAALADATEDWQAPAPGQRRSIILLTDGKVDISKEPGINAQARSALLGELLPRLQQKQVNVHTIALSDEADEALMRRLAVGTDGQFYQAETAEELQRIFLRLFERTVERETVPLEGNRFSIDDSVNEMTVLAFRGSQAQPTRLQTPSGATFGRSGAGENVRWFHERGYDLITVGDPEPGQWVLQADTDPDNRVMIVTDLRLRTTRLPSNLIAGERLRLAVALTEQGEVITREEFHSVLDVSVTQRPEQASRGPRWMLQDNGLGEDEQAGDGVYTLQLGGALEPGRHLIVTQAESPTFQREDRQHVTVHRSPVTVNELTDGQIKHLTVRPALDWVDPASLQIEAAVTRPDGSRRDAQAQSGTGGAQTLSLPESGQGVPVKVELTVAGATDSGRRFSTTLPPVSVAPIPQSTAPPTAGEGSPGSEAGDKAPKADWAFIGAVVAAVNLGVFGLLGLAYLLWHSRREKRQQDDDANSESAETDEAF